MLTLTEAAPGFSDEQLAKARSGDAAALASLIRAHQRSVYTLALRMLGTRELAEDLTQEVFMQLNRNLKSMASNTHLSFWLRYQEDLDPIDIARTLDMPINTVKSHLKRSLEILRQRTPNPDRSRCEDQST